MAFTDINRCHHIVARPGCACCTAEVRTLTRRVNTDLSRRGFMAGTASSVAMLGIAAYTPARAQTEGPKAVTLFTNVRLFDGIAPNTRDGVSVLVVDGIIADLAQGPLSAPDGATVIDGGGRTLMPGLIDAHWHTMLASLPVPQMLTADAGDIHFAAARQAERTLMRGFTTVRDAGGPSFPLKRAIDSGSVIGPRIYPSGAMISQTSGHGDYRSVWELPRVGGDLQRGEQLGASRIADGRDAVLQAAREQLMLGASQIKIVAGGGAASAYDPLDVLQYIPEEIEAAVLAAADWGTYVCAHVYTPRGIQRCLEAGVRSIEHGHLTDEESVMRIADAGAVWSLQPFAAETRPDGGAGVPADSKVRQLWTGTDTAYALAVKHKVPTGFGTDILFDPALCETQGLLLADLKRWYTPAQALVQATSQNAFILGMSGPRNPYPGALGVIQRGAHADIILCEGNPTEDLSLVADPDANFRVIMKAGTVFKNSLTT